MQSQGYVSRRKELNQLAVDTDFEAATIDDFVRAAITGVMPGGEKTALPLFPEIEMNHFAVKYADWALEPWSDLEPRPTTKETPLEASLDDPSTKSASALDRIKQVVSGFDKVIDVPEARPMIGRNSKLLKSKVSILHCADYVRIFL